MFYHVPLYAGRVGLSIGMNGGGAAAPTDGNLLTPVDDGYDGSGGWLAKQPGNRLGKLVPIGLAGVACFAALRWRQQRLRHKPGGRLEDR